MNEEKINWGYTYTAPDFSTFYEIFSRVYREGTFRLRGFGGPDYFVNELKCVIHDEELFFQIQTRYPHRPYPEGVAPLLTILYDDPQEPFCLIYYVMDHEGSVTVVDEYYRPIFAYDGWDGPDEDFKLLLEILKQMGVYGEALFEAKPSDEYLPW